jgi:ankyrin repeat protein
MAAAAAAEAEAGAKIRQYVLDDDSAGLEEYLRARVRENQATKRWKYYLGDVLNVPDDDGWCPLHHAFRLRRYDCAKGLINAGKR